jgi:hypothetical protein
LSIKLFTICTSYHENKEREREREEEEDSEKLRQNKGRREGRERGGNFQFVNTYREMIPPLPLFWSGQHPTWLEGSTINLCSNIPRHLPAAYIIYSYIINFV